MDYFIVENAQKQGPYDLISLIKKVKSGKITAETMISVSEDGEFVPASSIEEVNTLLQEHGAGAQAEANPKGKKGGNITFIKSFREGVDLWARHVVSFVVISGLILSITFGLSVGLKKITFLAEYPSIGNFIVSFFATYLYILFFNYILYAKRSQAMNVSNIINMLKNNFGKVAIISAIFSLYAVAFGIDEKIGIVAIVIVTFLAALCAFVPFLIFDAELSLKDAVKGSMARSFKNGTDVFGVVLTLVAINLIVSLLPAFYSPQLLFFGLFISIPITTASLAYIYDELVSQFYMEEPKELKNSARTYIIHPDFATNVTDPVYMLEEAVGLAHAIDLKVLISNVLPVRKPRPDLLLGSGQVDEIAEQLEEHDIELVYVNSSLSPVQQRNLETRLQCKVIDRSGLILEIFGDRAQTREGRMQVELAALEYQKTRVVRSWSHLERQRGGGGFTGGPGEKQSELDKRMINKRIKKIKQDLEKVVKTRKLHRKKREQTPYTVVALVGYTNAGKSTLFNLLTGANVMAQDQLFATLDPTMRILKTPSGRKIILSDTVGFISELPTELVAAFRATLEEVIEADILLHVRDISHPETTRQRENVLEVLRDLELQDKLESRTFEVLNKIDLLDSKPSGLAISALTGDGIDNLLEWLDTKLASFNNTETYKIDYANGKALAWLYENANVEKSRELKTGIKLTVNITPQNAARFEKFFL